MRYRAPRTVTGGAATGGPAGSSALRTVTGKRPGPSAPRPSLAVAVDGLGHLPGGHANGHEPGRLHRHTEHDCPAQRLADAHMWVTRVAGRLLPGDLPPAGRDELAGAESRGQAGHDAHRLAERIQAFVCHAHSLLPRSA